MIITNVFTAKSCQSYMMMLALQKGQKLLKCSVILLLKEVSVGFWI